MTNQLEVIVVGAGVMGCGTACWLSKTGYTSRAREIRGRIADQANQFIRHFYSLGANLSASNFPDVADPSKITPRKVDTSGVLRSRQVALAGEVRVSGGPLLFSESPGLLAKVLSSGRYYHSDIHGTTISDCALQPPTPLLS
jgi:glycine/D-amino acid oxidase-like deaminating enzyme